MSISRFWLVLFLTFLIAGVVCAQTDERKLEQMRTYYEDARTFESKGNWVEAEKAWRAVLNLAADDARAWTNLGVALNRQNKDDEAVAAWKQAIAIDPKLAGPYFNVGLTLVRRGNYTDALHPLRRALAIEPENDGARRALAVALIGVEKYPEATRELAQLLAHTPRDATLLEMAAESLMRQYRYAEATLVLRRRLDLPDATSRLWAQYGDALDGAARTPEAADAYLKAVELEPESTLFRYGLGYLHWKLYRYDEAESELLEVLRRDSKDPRAAFTLGDLYLTKGNAQRALPLLEAAATAYPNEFDTRFALGRALVLTGNSKRGLEELRLAVRLDDSIADGHFQLGRALMQAGLKDQGKRELEVARDLNEKKRAVEGERFRKKLP
ncbi:MAG TPA: tetratricopeptide repeat protein [Pyrinomonadaceae bacterium]|jgi:tetratricopeptide (TPR) repeat protein